MAKKIPIERIVQGAEMKATVTIYTSMDTEEIVTEIKSLDGVSDVKTRGTSIVLTVERPNRCNIFVDFCREVRTIDEERKKRIERRVVDYISPGQPNPQVIMDAAK